MCGINGIIQFGGSKSMHDPLNKMNNALSHRGPDSEGSFHHNSVSLGHRRLSIIDTSNNGNQPMFSQNKRYCIVFNGEVYNYKELKKTHLADHPFTTETDTEVVLAMFIKYGLDCLQHFNGMFAFVVYDTESQGTIIVRDRLGIKPLYYYRDDNKLIFSSELRAILKSGLVSKELDKAYLAEYLRQQTVADPNTIIKNIKTLLPGHYIKSFKQKININRYYEFKVEANSNNSPEPIKDIHKKVKEKFLNAVELRMRADVSFGAFLSGGIDSSAVVAGMSTVQTNAVETFSIIFDDPEFSEDKYAQIIAKKYNTNHHKLLLKSTDLLDSLPEAMSAMDHPGGDGINSYLVSKVTRNEGVKMALSGLGGDELFAGYSLFNRIYNLKNKSTRINWAPQFIKDVAAKALDSRHEISKTKIAEFLRLKNWNTSEVHDILRSTFSKKQIHALLNTQYTFPSSTSLNTNTHTLSEISLLEYDSYLKHVLLRDADQMSMAHGLEIRVPFLDHNLIEYVLQLPDSVKFPHTPKKLLVDSLGELIPSEIVNRPKMGFTFPWKNWLKTDLKANVESKLESLGNRAYFSSEAIQQLWKGFLNSSKDVSWSRIWSLVALEWWLQENDIL